MKIRITISAFVPEDTDLSELEKRAREAFFGLEPTDVEVEAL